MDKNIYKTTHQSSTQSFHQTSQISESAICLSFRTLQPRDPWDRRWKSHGEHHVIKFHLSNKRTPHAAIQLAIS